MKMRFFFAFLTCLFVYRAQAQCVIVVRGVPCVGNPIEFEAQAPGASKHLWNFNNEGSNNKDIKTTFTFRSTGTKTITYSCQLANGQSCSNSVTVTIKDTPDVRMRMISPPTQCFENNVFCFRDSSVSGDKDNCIKTIKYLFSDGELITKYGSKDNPVKLPSEICKSYVDPQGGDYGLTVEIEDCNGCIVKRTMPFRMKVELLPAIYANLVYTKDRCKGATEIKLYNQSQITLNNVSKFYWVFGDGTKDSVNWDSVSHAYNIGNKMTEIFAPKLVVYTGNGCAREFKLPEVIVYNLTPKIIKDRDSVCVGQSINFEVIPAELKQLITPDKVKWDFDPGRQDGYKASNTFNFVGPNIVSVSLSHVCGPYKDQDTIVVIGPKAIIEPDFIKPNERYQCVASDSVHVTDRSQYYHNDADVLDDDSLYSEKAGNLKFVFRQDPTSGRNVSVRPYDYDRDKDHVQRIWDFDDDYCLPCTTDRSKNENIGMNCRFSKDSMEVHKYTDWDSVYIYKFSSRPIQISYFNQALKTCGTYPVWYSDSMTVVVDSTLYYANNPLGISVRDSSAFATVKSKKLLPAGLFGAGAYDFSYEVNVYVPAGNLLTLNPRDNSPKAYVNGPQYFKVDPKYRMETSKDDSVYFIYAFKAYIDTIPKEFVRKRHSQLGRVQTTGYVKGDSVNPDLHRQLFYERYPRCFNIRLNLRDTVHPFKCESEAGAAVALMPPSAKKLGIADHYCYGYGNKVVDFQLSETKPGCLASHVWFNPDYINEPNNWQLVNNLYYGEVKRGSFLGSSAPYRGYGIEGPNGGRFYWVYNDSVLQNKNIQSINVGLIIGNGLDPNVCADTVYYNKFATFPRLKAGITFAEKNTDQYHACAGDKVWVTIPGRDPDANALADFSGWYMVNNSTGDTVEMITEEYKRVADHPKYPGKKVNYTIVTRYKESGLGLQAYQTDTIVTAVVKKYKAVALPGVGFNQLKEKIANLGFDITEIADTVILDMIWNGVGTIGVPSSGSKGCVDTAGFGQELDYYYRVYDADILSYKDSSLLPSDSVITSGGVKKRAYPFNPKMNSSYAIYHFVESYYPSWCPLENYVTLGVGFKNEVILSDTIICQGRSIFAEPKFRYFDIDSTTSLSYDTLDYWFLRQSQAGSTNREGVTYWDLSKEDDDKTKPATIFGAFPYVKLGVGLPGFWIGNEPGAIYYKKPGTFTMRVAASDSNGCRDTFTQKIYVTGPEAGFYTDIVTPNCKTILELFDTSKIIDPCVLAGHDPCDNIYKWTIDWGDGSAPLEYLKQLPKQIGHDYKENGYFRITLKIESILGCTDTMIRQVFIPGPSPKFIPETRLTICVNDSVAFRNFTSNYSGSSQWLWDFGDGFYAPQFDTGTVSHQYNKTGQFEVYLSQYDSIANSGKYCPAVFPDITAGQSKIIVTVIPYDTVTLSANPIVVCVGEPVTIKANLKTSLNYTNYVWNTPYGIVNTNSREIPFVPRKKGKFSISWMADTMGLNRGVCPDYDTIQVYADSVYADFVIDDSKRPVYCFRNRSKWAQSYRWGFFHDTDITVRRLKFETDETQNYPDSVICRNFIEHQGVNWVCLEARNELGCLDTVCRKLEVFFQLGIKPPNVFTPNDDGFLNLDKDGLPGNNQFNIYTENVELYHLFIYDRWGVLVFESEDQTYDWNGRLFNVGHECSEGTYYYLLEYRYKGKDDKEPPINGVIKLIR